MTETSPAEKSGMLSNILAVTGLVILIGIIIWGASHLAFLSGPWFSSSFSFSSKSLKVSVPTKKLPSGEQFSVSWKYSPEVAGKYAFLYQCREGFQFKTKVTGPEPVAIPCGIGYTMLEENNKFDVIPLMTGTSSIKVPISIIFMPSAVATSTPSRVEGKATVTIVGASSAPSQTAEPATTENAVGTQPQTVSIPASIATGNADLSVSILSKGVIDPISGDIIPRSPTSPNDLVAVRFLISNNGGSATGPWYFTAQLPTSPAYPYTSPAQASLKAGGSIENMLRFKSASPGGTFTVIVDPVNEVKESDEGNNSASQNI